jgi:hypothetical protein
VTGRYVPSPEWQAQMDAVEAEIAALMDRLGEIAAAGPDAAPGEAEEWQRLWQHQINVLDPRREALAAQGHDRYAEWLLKEGDQ